MKKSIIYPIALIMVLVLSLCTINMIGCDSSEDGSTNSKTYDRLTGIPCLQQILQCVGDIWKMQVTSCTVDAVNCIITTTYENGATAKQAEDGTVTFYGSLGGQCFTYVYTAGTGNPILYTIQITALNQTYTIVGNKINDTTVSEYIYCPENPGSPIIRTINIIDVATPNLCSPTDDFTPGDLGACLFQ